MTITKNAIDDKILDMRDAQNQLSFPDWLRVEREKRKWSQAELGEFSGLGRSIINKLESATQNPTFYNCISLASPFDMEPEEILRVAGLLPPKKLKNEIINKITNITLDLPADDQQEILEYARLRRRIAEERGRYDVSKGTKGTKGSPAKP